MTYIELAQGCRDKAELARLKKGLAARQTEILPITPAISQSAADLIDTLALSHGMRLVDALIGATAIEHGLTLITANVKALRRRHRLAARRVLALSHPGFKVAVCDLEQPKQLDAKGKT